MLPTRRQFLLGAGLGAATLAGGVVAIDGERLFDRVHPPRSSVPTGKIGALVDGSFHSRARSRDVRWAAAYPPGHRPGEELPIALVLHGRGADSHAAFGPHALDRFLAAAVRAGTPPYVLVTVDGGDHSYWHLRADGDDPQTMILEELLPLLAKRGLRVDRFGLTGWSMGGYGALLLASVVPQRVTAVAVDAPALWRRAADTAAGAFDGAADFARHNVLGHPERLAGIPVRVACGRSDPFASTSRELAAALPHAEQSFPRGGHDLACWNTLRPADLRFLGRYAEAQ